MMMSRRNLCTLAASALTVAGLASCSTDESHDEAIVETFAPLESATLPATDEYVRLIGRTCKEDDVMWLPQRGSGIELSVSSTSVSIELAGDNDAAYEKDLCPRFAILVDGKVILDDIIDKSTRTVEVFSGDTTRDAVVSELHLSEACMGAVASAAS